MAITLGAFCARSARSSIFCVEACPSCRQLSVPSHVMGRMRGRERLETDGPAWQRINGERRTRGRLCGVHVQQQVHQQVQHRHVQQHVHLAPPYTSHAAYVCPRTALPMFSDAMAGLGTATSPATAWENIGCGCLWRDALRCAMMTSRAWWCVIIVVVVLCADGDGLWRCRVRESDWSASEQSSGGSLRPFCAEHLS